MSLRRKIVRYLESIGQSRKLKRLRKKIVFRSTGDDELSKHDILGLILDWLCLAQDSNASGDRGVARHFALSGGWGASYPETTGYIIPTMLELSGDFPEKGLEGRATQMADWLVSIQLPSGGFAGSTVDNIGKYPDPVVFNTGQILIGLAAAEERLPGRYIDPLNSAARWLMDVQDENGSWERGSSPVANGGIRAYDTHVAFGLLEAGRVTGEKSCIDAACSNLDFTLDLQQENGWFRNCCLSDKDRPLTHTIGYTLRGFWEGFERTGKKSYLNSCMITSQSICETVKRKGFLPGRLNKEWDSSEDWQCLTGNSQIAHVLFRLFSETGNELYLAVGDILLGKVLDSIAVKGPDWIVGAVAGSQPVSGGYLAYQWINWGAKFTADAIGVRMGIHDQG